MPWLDRELAFAASRRVGTPSRPGKAWLKTYDWPRLEKSLKQVEAEYLAPKGITAVAAVGFCWGAYVAARAPAAKHARCTANVWLRPPRLL